MIELFFFILGIVVGILGCIYHEVAKSLPTKVMNSLYSKQATIVTNNPLDEIEL